MFKNSFVRAAIAAILSATMLPAMSTVAIAMDPQNSEDEQGKNTQGDWPRDRVGRHPYRVDPNAEVDDWPRRRQGGGGFSVTVRATDRGSGR